MMKKELHSIVTVGFILLVLMTKMLSAQPKPTVIMNQAYDYTGEWYKVGKTTFDYLSNNQTIQTEYGWIPPDWKALNRTLTTIDDHDNMTEFILEMPEDGEWTPVVHWAYANTYQNGRLMEVKQGDPALIQMGLFTSRKVYAYNADGKITQITQQLNTGSAWADISRSVYHYQGNDIDYITEEDYDGSSTSWTYNQKSVHTFTSGTLFSLEELEWDGDDWVPIELHEYYYSADGSIDNILVKDWQDGAYEIQRRFVYSYGGTSVNERSSGLPKTCTLSSYPNPFNQKTIIQFSIDADVQVSLNVFNVMGKKVRSLVVGELRLAGFHQLKWDGRNDAGQILPTGSYIYRLSTPDRTLSKMCFLIK
ncbi:MAG: FlgD immunoglobulin-like domain containing protein [candidate division KSB1 bacterium]|nr:FlgD immunoglobulin-like domain containing protein [candidate division KSB1 bacterium]